MGTISDKLMRIINTKEDIRQALISKGYDVPTSIPFKEYAKMISDLPCRVDSFPDIEGIVARYSALGLTNEQMATNPVWVDKTGNGHDLQMKNFFWGGMSGVGGYVQDFNYFKNNATVDKIRIDEQNSNSIKVTILTTGINNAIYIPKNIYQFNKSYSIKISSEGYNEGDLSLSFYAPSTSTATTVKVPLNPNGITEIPAIKEDDFLAVYLNVGGKVGLITIEQLPLYPGALVFDGVDDYGTCDNFPILTKEKGYTVVALRQWDQDFLNTTLTGGLLSTRNYSTGEGVAFEKIESSNKGYWNLGAGGIIDFAKSPFTWQTSKQYNNVGILKGDKNHGKPLCVGCGLSGGQQCGRFAIWELVFLDHDATEEELTKIKDYFVKTYPWLFPDQAWTVTGKTNEDEDRATIANITGNGNDLILSNFGFIEGSGYNEEGEYAGYLVTDGVDDKAVSKQFKFGKNFTVILDFKFPVKKISYCGFDLSSKVRIQNLQGSGVYVVLKGNKTLIPSNVVRAVTSEGKVYDENWNEYNIVPGNISSNYTMVNLGFDGSNQFAESATKLAGIYSSALSKDDCVKAYNYLQTLKSK